MNLDIGQGVMIRGNDGKDYRGKISQIQTSKRVKSTLHQITVTVYEEQAQPLRAPLLKNLAESFSLPSEK